MFFTKFKNDCRNKGFVFALQKLIQKCIGVNKLEEQIAALQYFNNILHDCSSMPPTADTDLRIMQKCDALQLAIFDKICKKYGIKYWLDYGTLLGAVRHKGFIPWDDDMDVAMLREDFDKIDEILRRELEKFNFSISCDASRIGLGYKHASTGIWMDIFPVDEFYSSKTLAECTTDLRHKIDVCHKKSKNHIEDRKQCEAIRKKYICNDHDAKYKILYHGPEFKYNPHLVHSYDDIIPLSSIEFEDYTFYAPANPDNYLRNIYGNNYLNFPKDGVLHHGEATGRPPLSQWAKLYGMDMGKVFEELTAIYNSIE